MVWLSAAAANRDPRVFSDPEDFVLDRRGNAHFGFAAGPHRCLGAHLARREMIIAAEEWHRRIPEYRLATDDQLWSGAACSACTRCRWPGT